MGATNPRILFLLLWCLGPGRPSKNKRPVRRWKASRKTKTSGWLPVMTSPSRPPWARGVAMLFVPFAGSLEQGAASYGGAPSRPPLGKGARRMAGPGGSVGSAVGAGAAAVVVVVVLAVGIVCLSPFLHTTSRPFQPGGIRTCNLRIRGPTPYPLGQGRGYKASCSAESHLFQGSRGCNECPPSGAPGGRSMQKNRRKERR